MALSKAEIRQANHLATEEVAVPEWGGSVLLREMTAAARDAWETSFMKTDAEGKRTPDFSNTRAHLAAAVIIDAETGEPMFTADELAGMSAKALERVCTAARRMNGIGGDDAVQEAEKNFDAGPAGNSTSDSPSPSA